MLCATWFDASCLIQMILCMYNIPGVPSCHSVMVAYAGADVFALTWQQPPNTPPVTSTTVTYCPTSSPNCTNRTDCTSPCVIGGLDPIIEYNFTVIQSNNCGSATGCTGTNSTAETASEYVLHNMLMPVVVSWRLIVCLHKYCTYIRMYSTLCIVCSYIDVQCTVPAKRNGTIVTCRENGCS